MGGRRLQSQHGHAPRLTRGDQRRPGLDSNLARRAAALCPHHADTEKTQLIRQEAGGVQLQG